MKLGIHPDEKIISLDNTAANLFRACPSRFKYRMMHDLVPIAEHEAEHPTLKLHYGIAWHSAMDVLYKSKSVQKAQATFEAGAAGLEQDTYNRQTIGRGVSDLDEYALRYEHELSTLELLDAEVIATAEIGAIGEWRVLYHGAIDKVLRLTPGGPVRVRDHKTTSYVSQGTAVQYQLSNQMLGYAWLIQKFLGYNDLTVDVDIVGVTRVKPPSEFVRTEVRATPTLLTEWEKEIMHTASMMLACYDADTWPRYGERACYMYNRRCDFFDICSVDEDFRPAQMNAHYVKEPWDPESRRENE
jgi:hypothetical protein